MGMIKWWLNGNWINEMDVAFFFAQMAVYTILPWT
jgi:hypothetical protein